MGKLYTFDGAMGKMDMAGLNDIKGIGSNFRRFVKKGSAIHISTSKGTSFNNSKKIKCFWISATEIDFVNIINQGEEYGYDINYFEVNDTNVDLATQEIKNAHDHNENIVVCLRNGSQPMTHTAKDNGPIPHKIIMFSNDSFNKIVTVLATNKSNCKV